MSTQQDRNAESRPQQLILVLSSDAVAAALVGALVETLGYAVRFHKPPEDPTATLGRVRPDVAMLDGSDSLMISDAVLGHASMRGISVVVFGSRDALDGIRELARTHRIHTLITPASPRATSELLSQALAERR
jgi:hypothetical protein